MSYQPKGRVENYTDAFLVTLGVILFMALWTIGAMLGFVWVVITAYAIDHLLRWVGRRGHHKSSL